MICTHTFIGPVQRVALQPGIWIRDRFGFPPEEARKKNCSGYSSCSAPRSGETPKKKMTNKNRSPNTRICEDVWD